jgi:hypothetical protein
VGWGLWAGVEDVRGSQVSRPRRGILAGQQAAGIDIRRQYGQAVGRLRSTI